ncbi:MAG: cytochrome c oxidase subunit II [Thiovulaceae bacterium]|nr:cytochrome c oxidase subunit II [Sulfurimonadaceae bacterium]
MLEGFDSQAATFAADVDQALFINLIFSVILFLSVIGPMVFFAWKYRASKVKNEDIKNIVHHTGLEITWTVIPSIMMFVLFYYGYSSMRALRTMPDASTSIPISVLGQKWSWNFTYPANADGYVHKTAEMYVPIDKNIILNMSAPINDVLHSFFIPAFRMKEDVVPGRITKQWFNSTEIGNYDIECAEYCGTRHSYMLSKVHVIEKADYEAWFNSSKRTPGAEDIKISKGQEVYETNGCSGCHSISDDSVIVGPSLMGIADKRDAQYIKDALVTPDKDVPEGFSAGVMPTFDLSDEDMSALLKFFNNTDKGEELYATNGCNGCHSIDDDSVLVGPSLKGISAKRGDAYLMDAIKTPNKDVPEGFSAGIMPAFALSDADMKELVKYLKVK